jgi:hypothetical protein
MSTFTKTNISFLQRGKEMNLYFVSLLVKDKERRKEISNIYQTGFNSFDSYWKKSQEEKDKINIRLKTRFPFLGVGDQIQMRNKTIFVWTGTESPSRTGCWNGREFIPQWRLFNLNVHPFFFDNTNRVFRFILDLVSKSSLEEITNNIGQQGFMIPRLKIGKRKYVVYLFAWDDLDFDFGLDGTTLKCAIERKSSSCLYDWSVGYNTKDEILSRQKRIFQIIYG